MYDGLCHLMLVLNALWDFVSGVAIWCVSCTQDVVLLLEPHHEQAGEEEEKRRGVAQQVASMHTGMWTRHADSGNHAACMLMAWWVVTLGCMRLLAAVMWGEWLMLAIVSYGIEGAAFLGEGLKSTMGPRRAFPASAFSLLCLLICVATYFR